MFTLSFDFLNRFTAEKEFFSCRFYLTCWGYCFLSKCDPSDAMVISLIFPQSGNPMA